MSRQHRHERQVSSIARNSKKILLNNNSMQKKEKSVILGDSLPRLWKEKPEDRINLATWAEPFKGNRSFVVEIHWIRVKSKVDQWVLVDLVWLSLQQRPHKHTSVCIHVCEFFFKPAADKPHTHEKRELCLMGTGAHSVLNDTCTTSGGPV